MSGPRAGGGAGVTPVAPAWLVFLNYGGGDMETFACLGFRWLVIAAPARRRVGLRRLWTTMIRALRADMDPDQRWPLSLGELSVALACPDRLFAALERCPDDVAVRDVVALARDDSALVARVQAQWGRCWLADALRSGPPSAGPTAREVLHTALVRRLRRWKAVP